MRRMLVSTLLLFVLGCDSTPEGVREWRASDHDHTTQPSSNQVEVSPDGGSSSELAAHGLDEVTLVAWQQNCTRCHGLIGRGDGPQGVALKPPDLTDANFQRSVKDEQLVRSIREGKGAMPPFALPDSTIAGLVRLVRLLDASRVLGAASGAPAPSAAPAASGAPGASAAPSSAVVKPPTRAPRAPASTAGAQ